MIDFEKLGREANKARSMLEMAYETIACDESIPEDDINVHTETIEAGIATLKAMCDRLAQGSAEFCKGYIAAEREALEAGRQWSEERSEKIALLRLSGDDTPEEQIPN